jgi:hypothetical protein
MLKQSASFVLTSFRSPTETRPPHISAARTDLVLLIRRTVRPRGYASGYGSPPALLTNCLSILLNYSPLYYSIPPRPSKCCHEKLAVF